VGSPSDGASRGPVVAHEGRTGNVTVHLSVEGFWQTMRPVEVRDQQRERLRRTTKWARRIRADLQPLLEVHGERVHFRPSSTGVAIVGLLPDRPQRGKSGITDLKSFSEGFEAMFDAYCRSVDQGRVTGEKALQSFLISEAQTHRGHLVSLNQASGSAGNEIDLVFVTDEISLPTASGKIICDILALRRDGGRCTPVVIELKDKRQLARLVEQVEDYAALVDLHADLFAELFGALLGEPVSFDGPTEKWIIWPAPDPSGGADPRTNDLLERHIRLASYFHTDERYAFMAGPAARPFGERAPEVTLSIGSIGDPRIADLTPNSGGEGFATYTGTFEGKPAFIVDCGTMNDLLDEEDRSDDSITVHFFGDRAARDHHVDELRRRSPAALGSLERERTPMLPKLDEISRVRGCLFGGAVGDALGAPVEFMSLEDIRRAFGSGGITEFAPAYGRLGAVTDDTQMTLFTAEGLVRAQVRYDGRGICHPPGVIHHALLRWLHTQGERSPAMPTSDEKWPDGWLITRKELFSRRAPGMTCLSALKAAKRFGDEPLNDSKGCGAIMRIAPIGLFVHIDALSEGTAPLAFKMGCDSAKSTHGHVTSTLSSGFFSLVIAYLLRGASLSDAISVSKPWVEIDAGSSEALAAIQSAVALASSEAPSSPETVELLGGGWVAEEALAISLFCALRAESFEHGVRLAVNHGGDSDSTGSLTGQLLGTLWGIECIPQRWVDQVELRDIVDELAHDLVEVTQGDSDRYWDRYPGW